MNKFYTNEIIAVLIDLLDNMMERELLTVINNNKDDNYIEFDRKLLDLYKHLVKLQKQLHEENRQDTRGHN